MLIAIVSFLIGFVLAYLLFTLRNQQKIIEYLEYQTKTMNDSKSIVFNGVIDIKTPYTINN
jgi:hypothetical protein